MKKIISLTLALVMVLMLLPAAVPAANVTPMVSLGWYHSAAIKSDGTL